MTATQSAIGDYRLVERIGGGAMGTVYRAIYQPTGAEVAIKLLPPDLVSDPIARAYFRRGAASTAALKHPHILPVYHYGESGAQPYLIMPLIRGGTLRDRIERGPVPPAEALVYLRQLAAALDTAHHQGVVHRDVKPANLLLDRRGTLYLADFGIATAMENATRYTRTGEGIGTPEYMAPEQARGLVDQRSDLYAAAIILYEMLTGRVPFTGASAIAVLLRHLQDPLPVVPLRTAQPALSPLIEAVLQRALAKDPDARYGSGAELVAAVESSFIGTAVRRETQVPSVAAVPQPAVAHSAPVATIAPQIVAPQRPPAVILQGLPATQGVVLSPPAAARRPARRAPALVGFSIALAVALLFASVGGVGAWFVRPRVDVLPATKTAALVDPTPTTQPAATPSPPPNPTTTPTPPASQSSSTPPLTPTPTPTPLPSTGPNSVPAGWKIYSSDALPFSIAYPPKWAIEEHLDENYVLFQSPDPNVWFEVLTLAREKPGAHIDGERDNFNNAFRNSCEGSGVEDTFNTTASGLTFAALLATCDIKGKLYAYYIGAGLYDDVPWYYVTFSPYSTIKSNTSTYFDPMLASLNIRAPR